MTAPTSIYINTRPIWELRLLRAIEHTLIEAAKQQPDPTAYLHSAYEFYEAAGWEPALALTLPHVPEQFRHLWTRERASDLMEWVFIIAMMRLDRQSPGRMMREAIIPALEEMGCTVERLEVPHA